MKRILCYGDSNTWGFAPEQTDEATGAFGRYPDDVRWPRRLETRLGSGYTVIEDAYNGRTTCFEDPSFGGRNALDHFFVSFYSHEPLDLVILMLGTNDIKDVFSAQPCVIGWGMERLIRQFFQMTSTCVSPHVQLLLVAPPALEKRADGTYYGGFSKASAKKSRALPPIYADIAARWGCGFFDAAACTMANSIDGIHLDQKGCAVLSERISEKVRSMLS